MNDEVLTIEETLDMMHSDFRLWERAQKEQVGSTLSLTLVLPWGIGRRQMNLEGITNAESQRKAVSTFGEWIRSLIDEATNDEAVTSRAAAKAARAEQDDSGRSAGGLPPVPEDTGDKAEALESAGIPHQEDAFGPVGLRETLAARRAYCRERLAEADRIFDKYQEELEMIDKALGGD